MSRSKTTKKHARHNLLHVTTCAYCGKTGDGQGLDGRPWHLDHVTPLSRGGADSLANIVKCCALCNLRKADKEWMPEPGTLCGTGETYDVHTALHSDKYVGSPKQQQYHGRNYELQAQVAELQGEITKLQRELDSTKRQLQHSENMAAMHKHYFDEQMRLSALFRETHALAMKIMGDSIEYWKSRACP